MSSLTEAVTDAFPGQHRSPQLGWYIAGRNDEIGLPNFLYPLFTVMDINYIRPSVTLNFFLSHL